MRISVCIATYNGEKHIKEQIDSIIKQLGPDDEIIVSDDGSKDETISILNEYNDSRIKIYLHKPCGTNSFEKVTNNFENALRYTTGDYIFLSDQDDVWKENKVSAMVEALQDNIIVQCQLEPFGAMNENKYDLKIIKRDGFWANLYNLPFVGCCMAFRKSMLDYILPFPKGIAAHDAWIGMVGVALQKYSFIDKKYQCYRLHGNNVSGISPSTNTIWYRIMYRWKICMGIIRRFMKMGLNNS